MYFTVITAFFHLVLINRCSASDLTATSDSTAISLISTYLQNAKDTSAPRSLFWCKKALNRLPGIQDDKIKSEVLFQLAYAYFDYGEIDSCLYYCDSIKSLKKIPPEIRALTNNYLCMAYRRLGNYDKALKYGKDALRHYISVEDKKNEGNALVNIGKVFNKTGQHDSAIFYYYKSLNIAETMDDTLSQVKILGLITYSYLDMGKNDYAAELYEKTIRLLVNYQNTIDYADVSNNYGTLLFDLGKYDSAYLYFLKAGEIYRLQNKKDALGAFYQNRGITEVKLGRTYEGLKNLHKALSIFKELKLVNDQASALTDLGLAFSDLNNYDSSMFYLTKALRLSEKIHDSFDYKTALKYLYLLNKKYRHYDLALNYHTKYIAFKDSLENLQIQKNIQELQIKYETVKHEKEIKDLKNRELIEKANNRQLWFSIIILFVIFSFTGIFMFVKRKKDIEIHTQKVALMEKGKELDRLELERRKEQQMQLEEKLEFKTKQMATHAMNMMQKNNMVRELIQNINEQMAGADEKHKKLLKNIKYKLEQDLKTEKDWALFKRYFEQINVGFYDNLKKINPNLTGNDLKLTALIKLNLSVKEMSSVLNISPDSLKNAKYRLKKKLGLGNDIDLNRFIAGL